jgi:cytoskeletal protein CcmA (bactofilin family)
MSTSATRPAPAPANTTTDRDSSSPLAVGSKISIRGTIIARGDVYLNGEVEGKVEAVNSTVTVGPNAKVVANLDAKKVVIVGTVDGNVKATEVIEVQKTGSITGDVSTARIAIEDGAFFKGSVNIIRPEKEK